MSGFVSRGFTGRRRAPEPLARRLPPGQYLEEGFPVLSAGPTERIDPRAWSLTVDGAIAGAPRRWDWDAFHALPFEDVTCDIHCVTKWSKLGTRFRGVSIDTLLDGVAPRGDFAMAYSFGGYTTNLPLADLTGGKAWVVTEHEGAPLSPEHGGPARLLVPHRYFWKSAKWVAGLRVMEREELGYWERNGYHRRGDPWREERYWSD
jgi:DMSO/TMAO reductase YedYZ molybdopterin-dependent catalytic subunit